MLEKFNCLLWKARGAELYLRRRVQQTVRDARMYYESGASPVQRYQAAEIDGREPLSAPTLYPWLPRVRQWHRAKLSIN